MNRLCEELRGFACWPATKQSPRIMTFQKKEMVLYPLLLGGSEAVGGAVLLLLPAGLEPLPAVFKPYFCRLLAVYVSTLYRLGHTRHLYGVYLPQGGLCTT